MMLHTESENGQIQRKIVGKWLLNNPKKSLKLLEVACREGFEVKLKSNIDLEKI